ncbi:MAG: mechanosensitive ion channel family protein [Anaerovoracaceae bacterium]
MSEHTIAFLIKAGKAGIIFLGGFIALKIILHILKKALEKSKLDEALHAFILNATKIILWVVLIISLLSFLEVPAAPFITVLGACGAAIALALKDSLGNIAGGIIIIINKPFGKGDTIEISGVLGKVESIDLLVTQLKTFDNKVVTVPNGTITNSVLVNYSRENMRRVDCVFNISYDADLLKAKEILQIVAESNPDIFSEPEPIIGVASHLDSAVTMDLKVWCATENFFDIKYFLEENVKLAFDEVGISIPYPQMDVHVIK